MTSGGGCLPFFVELQGDALLAGSYRPGQCQFGRLHDFLKPAFRL